MSSVKAAIIVNPASANGKTFKRWPEFEAAFKQEGLSYEYAMTEAPEHAIEITRKYLSQGYKLIIAVGGDGTANEVVNGFFLDGEDKYKDAAVSFISTGTGRDLARTLGTPVEASDIARHILNSPERMVDIGKITYTNLLGKKEIRYFINIAGLGLDGDTCARVNRTSKALGGFVSFLWGTLTSLAMYKNQEMTITVDGKLVVDEPVTVVVAGNGRYFGGGMHVAPNAEIDDGYFDIVILRDLSKINLLVNLPKVYSGSHLNHPRITSLRGKNIKVSSSGTALLELDGEQAGQAPVEIEMVPKAIKLKG